MLAVEPSDQRDQSGRATYRFAAVGAIVCCNIACAGPVASVKLQLACRRSTRALADWRQINVIRDVIVTSLINGPCQHRAVRAQRNKRLNEILVHENCFFVVTNASPPGVWRLSSK